MSKSLGTLLFAGMLLLIEIGVRLGILSEKAGGGEARRPASSTALSSLCLGFSWVSALPALSTGWTSGVI